MSSWEVMLHRRKVPDLRGTGPANRRRGAGVEEWSGKEGQATEHMRANSGQYTDYEVSHVLNYISLVTIHGIIV